MPRSFVQIQSQRHFFQEFKNCILALNTVPAYSAAVRISFQIRISARRKSARQLLQRWRSCKTPPTRSRARPMRQHVIQKVGGPFKVLVQLRSAAAYFGSQFYHPHSNVPLHRFFLYNFSRHSKFFLK